MWSILQSADVVLNGAWLSLSLATLLTWRFSGRSREHKRAMVVLLFILVLLFPVISTADDMAEQALMCELAPSPLSAKSAKEIKQSITPQVLTVQVTLPSLHPPVVWRGDRVQSRSVSGFTLFLGSASGIHSPPQF